jgi:hypothetical protein
MKQELPTPAASEGGLSNPAQVEQLADQFTACANALHERIMHEIQSYQGGPVPLKAQDAARQLLDDEQVLRQRANSLYADAASLIVHTLGKSQQHVVALTTDAAGKLKTLVKIADTMGVVGRLLEFSGAALTGNPILIMRSLEDMHHMMDALALHNPPAPAPTAVPAAAPAGAPATPAGPAAAPAPEAPQP